LTFSTNKAEEGGALAGVNSATIYDDNGRKKERERER